MSGNALKSFTETTSQRLISFSLSSKLRMPDHLFALQSNRERSPFDKAALAIHRTCTSPGDGILLPEKKKQVRQIQRTIL